VWVVYDDFELLQPVTEFGAVFPCLPVLFFCDAYEMMLVFYHLHLTSHNSNIDSIPFAGIRL